MRKKLKHNSKATKIKCIRCEKAFLAHRNDAKFCSSLCKVQESLERKENGYTILLVAGSKKELENHFLKLTYTNPFSFLILSNDDLSKVRNAMAGNEEKQQTNLSWKFKTIEYLLYCFPHLKKKPFELYCTKEQSFKSAILKNDFTLKPTIVRK